MATEAVKALEGQGAKVVLQDYPHGHGWKPGFYDDDRAGITWLENNATAR